MEKAVRTARTGILLSHSVECRRRGKISLRPIIGSVPKVTFLPANETFEFNADNLPYKGHGFPASLLDVAMNFGFHLEHACGGNCACTTCHVVVKQGQSNLSESRPPTFSSTHGWAARRW